MVSCWPGIVDGVVVVGMDVVVIDVVGNRVS